MINFYKKRRDVQACVSSIKLSFRTLKGLGIRYLTTIFCVLTVSPVILKM